MMLEVTRSKKQKNLGEKSGSSSKQNVRSYAQNVDKDAVLLNVSHNNDSDCRVVTEKLKNNPNSFLVTNMVSEAINVDSNNTQS